MAVFILNGRHSPASSELPAIPEALRNHITERPPLTELLAALLGKWSKGSNLPTLAPGRVSRSSIDVSTGVTVEAGETIHGLLSSLLQRGAPGVSKIVLLGIISSGYV